MCITNIYEYNLYDKFVKKKTGLFLLSLMLLTACSTVSESFDTEATQGVGAKSISQVNAMIDKGEIPGVKAGGDTGDVNTVITPILSTAPLPHASAEPIVLSDNTVIHRQPEKVMRIWIAPFQDGSGNFHEASVVHSLQRPSFWTAQMLAPSAVSYGQQYQVDTGTYSLGVTS